MEGQTAQAEQEFSIKPTVEHTPFSSETTQQFFTKWCELNDGIVPHYISRDEWEEPGNKMLQPRVDGKSTLFIPKDLKLWEMADIIDTVHADTFKDKPDAKPDSRGKITALGEQFTAMGIYLARRSDGINEGKDIAIETAKEFYRYGNALKSGIYEEAVDFDSLRHQEISAQQTAQIDKWLEVDAVVRQRNRDFIDDDSDTNESTRQEILNKFFKTAELAKEGDEKAQQTLEKKWQHFLERPLTMPREELEQSIIERGLEKLVNNLGKDGWRDEITESFKKIGYDLEDREENLRVILNIPKMKSDIENARKSGDINLLSEKMKESAWYIQQAISAMPYDMASFSPSTIQENQSINCAGASMLGSKLFSEIGVDHLVVSVPKHSITFIITPDQKVYWFDLLRPYNNEKIIDEDLEKGVTVEDIIKFSKESQNHGLRLDFDTNKDPDAFPFFKQVHPRTDITAFTKDSGIKVQALQAVGEIYRDFGDTDEAIYTYKDCLKIDANDYTANFNLGYIYANQKNWQEARKYYGKLINNGIKAFDLYYFYGGVLQELDEPENALNAYDEAIKLGSTDINVYLQSGNLLARFDKYEEAKERFFKAAEIEPENAKINLRIGIHYEITKEFTEAEKYIRKAIELEPDNIYNQYELGIALKKQNKINEAKEYFEHVLEVATFEANDTLIYQAQKHLETLG